MIRYAFLLSLCALAACEDYEMAAPVGDVAIESLAASDGTAPVVKVTKQHRKKKVMP